MKKWYICTLIITLALLGTLGREQSVAPNQQIVLQFTNSNISSDKAQNTILIVKEQLQDLGVNNIRVEKQSNGSLKISYYSTVDIASIKKILSEERYLAFNTTSPHSNENENKFPSEKETSDYNLDIYKILDGSDTESGLDGRFVLEPKLESDRFFNPNVFVFATEIKERENNRIVKVAYKVRRAIASALNNTSHNIPEVRAGPVSSKTS